MHYVKAKTIGPAGHTPLDPQRRDRIPAEAWRPVQLSGYWARLARDGDVLLRADPPSEDEIEGYEGPVKAASRRRNKPSQSDEGSVPA